MTIYITSNTSLKKHDKTNDNKKGKQNGAESCANK
jgi:hypothetical protein